MKIVYVYSIQCGVLTYMYIDFCGSQEVLQLEQGLTTPKSPSCLYPIPKSEKGLWVSVGRIHSLRFLCESGT